MSVDVERSRIHLRDVVGISSIGMRTRPLRAALSALGVAIGIAAMVAVLGLSESSRADLLTTLDRLGTDLLTVRPGQSFSGEEATLPDEADDMIARISPVTLVSSVADLEPSVRRTDFIDEKETGGIVVKAADPDLLDVLGGQIKDGRFLDAASPYRTVVLGSVAAARLGVTDLSGEVSVFIGDEWYAVVGVLRKLDLAADIDRSALISFRAAREDFSSNGLASTIYLRSDPEAVDSVRPLLPETANPASPEEVQVSQPSDALSARAAAETAFTDLFLGLGAVALLVGGIGIANVMVISVLERRSEIGLRRALGATRRHVGLQFLSEALLLATVGGVGGALLGSGATAVYASLRGWEVVVPLVGVLGGVAAAILIGVVAGLYPALRAARMSPTEALRSS